MQKTSFLVLIIYTLFSLEGFSQKLQLKIDGFTEAETRVLDSLGYQKNHLNFLSVKSEVDSIQNRLFNIGYIENKLTELLKVNDSSFLSKIHLKNKVNTIYIHYNKNDIDKSVINLISRKVFNDYFILDISEVEKALSYINSEISKNGLPFSKLKLTNIRSENHSTLKADLILDVTNQKRTIDNIVIKGYEKFPRSYIKHFLKLKPKQVFNLSKIQNKTAQLNNLNFANEIKPPEVLFSKDSTALFLYLEKSRSNTFDGFLGFGTNEETNKLQFDGYLNLNLTNNLNFGESFKLLYKSDENDQQIFEANISLPYLFKSPIGVDLLLRIFRKDSSFTTANQSAKLHYQINSKHKISTGITAMESNSLLSENTTQPITDYRTQYLTLAYQYITYQNYNALFPIHSKLSTEAGFGNRTTSETSEKQTQLLIDSYKIFNLNQKNSIYLRVNGGYLISSSYFENELLRFGGINSIRGFEENSLFASLYGLINTEYRLQLSNSIYIHSIIDAAYFENKITNTEQKLFGYGFGFGILTKAGLFKFNYANGKNENTSFKLSNSKVHLSLMTNF
ncbi:POTRA domain-containing protein [Tamlana sp. 2201CG12-4]|uniref:POTRA domain-containing protein n=1 Tax=Tamlana sp. 2201CG12-4 TaxID=3112582 RepID=UPI002DBED471|nr:POTRA domain-containing protein [Tamlana sp. 2201CG12-4]MEC3906911.1 POTRA domain-containing protein [Tamlana sp. 2201CG12-4]